METREIILGTAIRASNSSESYKELDILLEKLETKDVQSLLLEDADSEVSATDHQIRAIVSSSIVKASVGNDDLSADLSQIIGTLKTYLKRGIQKGNLIDALLFLRVNCYVGVKINELLSQSEVTEDSTLALAKKINELLKAFSPVPSIPTDAPFHERKLLDDALEGFKKDNLGPAYALIRALEAGPRGLRLNFLLENLISFLYELNLSSFVQALSPLKSIFEFVFFLQGLGREVLSTIANTAGLSNKWLNFELIRQIQKHYENETNKTDTDAIFAALKKIKEYDFNFLTQTVNYFKKSLPFCQALGRLIPSFNNSQMENIIKNCFNIGKDASNLAQMNALEQELKTVATQEQFDYFITQIFNKWTAHLSELYTKEDLYQNSILLTDVIGLVVEYHSRLSNDERIIAMMNELIGKIEHIDSVWSLSKTQQLTVFHLYHSELLLLTHVYRNRGINDTSVRDGYHRATGNKMHIARYASEETLAYFDQGRDNVKLMTSDNNTDQ